MAEVMGPTWRGPDWLAWRAFIKVLFGEYLDEDEKRVFITCTGLDEPPKGIQREAWLPVGRRGGKSRIEAMIAVHLACCYDWTPYLAPGELGYITVLADQRDHASAIMNYAKAALEGHPKLRGLVKRQLVETVELEGRVEIEVVTASIKAVRSRTVIAALCVAGNTEVQTEYGPRLIRNIQPGDRVWTRVGLRDVISSGMTSPSAEVYQVRFSNGKRLVATADHPVFVRHKGFVKVCCLSDGDEVVEWQEAYASTAKRPLIGAADGVNHALLGRINESAWKGETISPSMESRSSNGKVSAGISPRMDTTGTGKGNFFIDRCIWRSTDLSLRVTKSLFIMRTTLEEIFQSIISSVCPPQNILLSTVQGDSRRGVQEIPDIRRASALCGLTESRSKEVVPPAELSLNLLECGPSTVVVGAPEKTLRRCPVYNLKIDGEPEFFANSVLVHNCDEIAFWQPDETCANPDVEIINALRPAMITIPNSMQIGASSRYARKGVLWNAYRDHYGKPDGPLVWSADTETMHPSIDKQFLADEYERDPIAAAAEYGLEWRSDVAAFISREAVEAVVARGVFERPPVLGTIYRAFVDPSGGSADSFTLSIAHWDRAASRSVLDVVREVRPPFGPESVVVEFGTLLKMYRISQVSGDHYAGEWPREQFRKIGISYEPSAAPKSQIYQEWLPMLNSGQVELLDLPRLITQACGLERRTSRAGRDSIDHAPGAHDDVVNAAAGALVDVVNGAKTPIVVSNEVLMRARAMGSTRQRLG